MEIDDLSVTGILEALTSRAYRQQCGEPAGSFLLAPSAIAFGTTAHNLSRALNTLYQHARSWAPGLDVPCFVPPVRIADLESEAGHFQIDREGYASIAVSAEYLGNMAAISLILAHEACHHILFQSGVSFQFKHDVILNERITDLAMFVCGFGDIVRHGYSVVRARSGRYLKTHLGYLNSAEYEAAYGYVLAKRRAKRLPGTPIRPSAFSYIYQKIISGVTNRSAETKTNSALLTKIIEETDRRNRHGR